jgi:hypothetical protein
MPFESKQQSKACFATNGFGGKVDCKEWASHTDYKSLPKKKDKKVKHHSGLGSIGMKKK